jgi:SpoVK/Ycf46/Vps4 family AAA+-type ATPase
MRRAAPLGFSSGDRGVGGGASGVQSGAHVARGLGTSPSSSSAQPTAASDAAPAPAAANPPVRFSDVIGLRDAKRALRETILLPRLFGPGIFSGVRRLPTTVLLWGPPGTGKTLLVRAAAHESGRRLVCVTPSAVLSKWAGDSEKSLRRLFEAAAGGGNAGADVSAGDDEDGVSRAASRATRGPAAAGSKRGRQVARDEGGAAGEAGGGDGDADGDGPALLLPSSSAPHPHPRLPVAAAHALLPSSSPSSPLSPFPAANPLLGDGILFFDEIDALAPRRDGSGGSGSDDSGARRLLTELLILLSDLPRAFPNVLVLAATNRPQDCDPALLRRFDARIPCGLPSAQDRRRLLLALLAGVPHSLAGNEAAAVAAWTEGWNGADLRSLASEAAMMPVREALSAAARAAGAAGWWVDDDEDDEEEDEEGRATQGDAHAGTASSPSGFDGSADEPMLPFSLAGALAAHARPSQGPPPRGEGVAGWKGGIPQVAAAAAAPRSPHAAQPLLTVRPVAIADFERALLTVRPTFELAGEDGGCGAGGGGGAWGGVGGGDGQADVPEGEDGEGSYRTEASDPPAAVHLLPPRQPQEMGAAAAADHAISPQAATVSTAPPQPASSSSSADVIVLPSLPLGYAYLPVPIHALPYAHAAPPARRGPFASGDGDGEGEGDVEGEDGRGGGRASAAALAVAVDGRGIPASMGGSVAAFLSRFAGGEGGGEAGDGLG